MTVYFDGSSQIAPLNPSELVPILRCCQGTHAQHIQNKKANDKYESTKHTLIFAPNVKQFCSLSLMT
jgi:hypothetical protein